MMSAGVAQICRRAAMCGVAALSLASCSTALDPGGAIAVADRTILIDSLAIMLAIVVPTIGLAALVAWWYRRSNTRARRYPDFVFSGRVELVVWSVPLMTIMLLGGVTWVGAHSLDPARPIESRQKPIEIEAISLDWKWLFIYPEQHVASVNALTLPAGTPIHFSLTSGSVMNAFFVPELGSMIYTMNGMISRLNLVADRPGSYYGESAHYSGDGFSDMHFMVQALPPQQFLDWANATHGGTGPALDQAAYAKLARQSRNVTPFLYRDVDGALFHDVASQKIAQSPGPVENGTPNASVSSEVK